MDIMVIFWRFDHIWIHNSTSPFSWHNLFPLLLPIGKSSLVKTLLWCYETQKYIYIYILQSSMWLVVICRRDSGFLNCYACTIFSGVSFWYFSNSFIWSLDIKNQICCQGSLSPQMRSLNGILLSSDNTKTNQVLSLNDTKLLTYSLTHPPILDFKMPINLSKMDM